MLKLLVFAPTPPPVHSESVMIATLLDGLRADAAIQVLHVNAPFAHHAAGPGWWRPGKIVALLRACLRAWKLRAQHGPVAFYYVPAPPARLPLYRDLLVMLLCRPFFPMLILHWHAIGLGRWLELHATWPERWLARRLLGRADLAIVLAPLFAADAAVLHPRRTAVVPNSAPDPGEPAAARPRAAPARCEVLFLGVCTREKGLFAALEGVALANRRAPGAFRFTVAGGFVSPDISRRFHERMAGLPHGAVRYVGFAPEEQKRALYAAADVFLFPTNYAQEGQPLALVEALAHDVPIITTRWRAIPGLLPPEGVWFVEQSSAPQIADALEAARTSPRPHGALRRHYLANYTAAAHVQALRAALLAGRAGEVGSSGAGE